MLVLWLQPGFGLLQFTAQTTESGLCSAKSRLKVSMSRGVTFLVAGMVQIAIDVICTQASSNKREGNNVVMGGV